MKATQFLAYDLHSKYAIKGKLVKLEIGPVVNLVVSIRKTIADSLFSSTLPPHHSSSATCSAMEGMSKAFNTTMSSYNPGFENEALLPFILKLD